MTDHHTGDGHEHEHEHPDGAVRRVLHALKPHSHDSATAIESAESSAGAGVRAAWISLIGMMATAAVQLAIVAISGSLGLLADTVHNLGHAITTIPLLVAFRLGLRPPTSRFPYGYRRAEDVAGILIALVIALSAALIVAESVGALLDPRAMTNTGWVLAAALAGAVGNELVAVYRIRVGRRIGSAALVAEGQHARADGLTSLVVVFGVVGTWLGFPRADAVVGLVVAAAILWLLVTSARTIVRRLMDGVDDGTVDSIATVAGAVPGVRGVGRVRARWTGHRIEADVEVSVDGAVPVRDGHLIAADVLAALVRQVPHLHHAVVHLEPADGMARPDVPVT
ncbi:cation diffusion facilitator family transporter [Haloactinopolyspora alba]|uniref:Cation diffusion facilitator family transporter n=1 Tax=Haloactinopolyspora alba TaxID=648780 RepID=A0A2P8E064_9ACTN|nr:cation diffusion facilitator family transporter [Haloactinopolyspora alba]PSL02862.1 cation diffusion facilitator family transporter [Haloactinopolyspora alba]